MPLCRQHKAARGGKVELARVARDLTDDKGKIAATDSFLQREERFRRVFHRDVHHPVPQIAWQARMIGPPAQSHRSPILYP